MVDAAAVGLSVLLIEAVCASDIALGDGNQRCPWWNSQSDGGARQVELFLWLSRISAVLKVQTRPCASRELNLGVREALPEEVTLDFWCDSFLERIF